MKHHRISQALAIASLATLALAACGSDSNSADIGSASSEPAATLTVIDAWSRQPAEGQDLGVVYATVTNPGDSDVRILAATSPVSDDVELHETTASDSGAMSMNEVEEGFVVSAGGEFVFEPGGAHIMLLAIDAATYPTDEVAVTLDIEGGDPVSFAAPVRAIGAADGAMEDMDDMEDMEDMDRSGTDMDDSPDMVSDSAT